MDKLTHSVPEAAALLGISRAAAYKAVKVGEIPSIAIGGRVLVPVEALQQLVRTPSKPQLNTRDLSDRGDAA